MVSAPKERAAGLTESSNKIQEMELLEQKQKTRKGRSKMTSDCMDQMNNRLQASEQRRRTGMAGVQMKEETSWQRHDTSTDGVTQDIPSTETHTLHTRPFEEQRGTGHHEEKRDPVSASGPGPCDHEKGSSPRGEFIRGGIVHAANVYVARTHVAAMTLPKTEREEIMSRYSRKELDWVTVVRSQSQRQVYQGQMKSPARLTAHARDLTAVVVLPDRRADNLPYYRKPIEVTLSSIDLAEVRFPTTGNVETNFGGFRPEDCSEGYSGASLEARDTEPLGGISFVEDLDYDDGVFGEKSERLP